MEPRFGHKFADVRVHTGSRANASASSLGARTFTLSNNIVFSQAAQVGGKILTAEEYCRPLAQERIAKQVERERL